MRARVNLPRTAASTTAVQARTTIRRRRLGRRALVGYAFVTPAILFLLVFAAGPFLFTIYVSLHDWNMLTPIGSMPFRGLDNYRYLLTEDPLFRQTFRNTVVYALGTVGTSVALALAVALVLNTGVRFRAFWRAVFFLPYITSSVAIAIVWNNLYQPNYGLFNGVLELANLPTQDFLSSLGQAMPSVIAVAVWHGVGYYMIIFLAGLQAIPVDVYEAAKLDGAGFGRLLVTITLPLLRPTLLFVVVVNTLNALQVFDLVFILTSGGPVNATNTVVLYMYDTAFQFLRMGRATAMAVMLFGVIFVITLIQLRLLREKE
jgi:ABC-type sugar transport system permease subunit